MAKATWADAKPKPRKGEKGRITSNASFATVGKNKLTVYRVKKTSKLEVWHAAVNGKRVEKSFNNMAEAKAEAEKAGV